MTLQDSDRIKLERTNSGAESVKNSAVERKMMAVLLVIMKRVVRKQPRLCFFFR